MTDTNATIEGTDALARAAQKIGAGLALTEMAGIGAQWRVVEQERQAAADEELAAMERALATGGKMPSVAQAEERAAKTAAEKAVPVVVVEDQADPNATRMDFLEL